MVGRCSLGGKKSIYINVAFDDNDITNQMTLALSVQSFSKPDELLPGALIETYIASSRRELSTFTGQDVDTFDSTGSRCYPPTAHFEDQTPCTPGGKFLL